MDVHSNKKKNHLYHQKNTTNNFIQCLRQLKVVFQWQQDYQPSSITYFQHSQQTNSASQLSEYNKVDASPENLIEYLLIGKL